MIGTAGHVDHGKSTLVEALTSRDPDRWDEEKRRGLTIDLGFAWADFGSTEVSFVDVPGHERYLKNMLAGIEAIDAALLVVAADEGWMPQSEEHLAVLDLLSVDRGLVALTKSDLVDEETIEIARLEILDQLEGTSLAEAPIIAVSAADGNGLDDLRSALELLVTGLEGGGDRPRMWIDRAFTISGAGTVVTGTLLGGPLSIGDQLVLYPVEQPIRVRSLQSHEKDHDSVTPNRRVAINISGAEVADAPRGSMLGVQGQWDSTERFTVAVRTARYTDELTSKGAYQLHIGSKALPVTIQAIRDSYAVLAVDERLPGLVRRQLQEEERLPLRAGDRFILRDTGRQLVVAGGVVLDPNPGRMSQALDDASRIDPSAAPDDIADALLQLRGSDELVRLAAHSGGGTPSSGILIGDEALTAAGFADLTARAEELVASEHETNPLRPGLPLATLAKHLGVAPEVAERAVEQSTRLKREGPVVAETSHDVVMSENDEEAWMRARSSLEEGLAVPRLGDLGMTQELSHLLIRSGRLVQISDDLVFLPQQIEQLVETMKGLADGFTVAEFRDATGLSRKYAVPVLEWADKEGLTVRRGDLRQVR